MTHKDPACGTGSLLSRRTLLTAIPATGAALAAPAMALSDAHSTKILRLFAQHRAIIGAASEHICTFHGRYEDQELERLYYRHSDRIEAQMMALPCTSAADFAAKVIVDTCNGSIFTDWETGAIWQEARALTELGG